MTQPETILRYSLLACVVLFLAMATAHFFGIKIPVLFVYYDTPFFAYQDKIIAFCVVVYALFFLAASRHQQVVPYAITAMYVTSCGLTLVNVSDALDEAMTAMEGATTTPYWIQTGAIFGIAVWLTVWWRMIPKARTE
ncbi:MAG: hypothetical protein HQL50_07185 [Magnetococcales bacterium]|nr:hypothetical protein [Magnetococcales bacterium]